MYSKYDKMMQICIELYGEEPIFDSEGRCLFTIDQETLALDLPEGDSFYYLSSILLKGKEVFLQRVVQKALEANLYWVETEGATVMLDSKNEQLLLCFRDLVETATTTAFQTAVSQFRRTLETLKKNLSEENNVKKS